MATGAQGGGRQWAIIGSVIVVLLALGGVYLYSYMKATSKPLAEVSSLETWLNYNGYDVFKPLRDDMPPGSLIKLNGSETLLVMSSAELFGENASTTSPSTAPDVSLEDRSEAGRRGLPENGAGIGVRRFIRLRGNRFQRGAEEP